MLDASPTCSPQTQELTPHTSSDRRPHSAGFSLALGPHEGYRQYLQESPVDPATLIRLFEDGQVDERPQFPSIPYAAGWAHAEYAIEPTTPDDERMQHIQLAEERWQKAIRMTGVTYEMLPGRFLLWPCTKWRYQFAVDTVPTLQAIAQARQERARGYDPDLLHQSRENVNATIQKLMGKYAWTLQHYTVDEPGKITHSQLEGRLGAIFGVALEGAALSAAQLGSNGAYAILPPSLRQDNAGAAGVDIVAHSMHGVAFSAQIKKRVHSQDRKKYQRTALICAVHHMRQPDESLYEVVNDIADGAHIGRVRRIGEVLLKVIKGSPKHGCSPFNPRPAHVAQPGSRARHAA